MSPADGAKEALRIFETCRAGDSQDPRPLQEQIQSIMIKVWDDGYFCGEEAEYPRPKR